MSSGANTSGLVALILISVGSDIDVFHDVFHGAGLRVSAYRQLVSVAARLLFAHLPFLGVDDDASSLWVDVAG